MIKHLFIPLLAILHLFSKCKFIAFFLFIYKVCICYRFTFLLLIAIRFMASFPVKIIRPDCSSWWCCHMWKGFTVTLFLAVLGLCGYTGFSRVVASGGSSLLSAQAALCDGFSRCRAWAGGCMGFRSCGSRGLEHSLNSCGAWLDWSAAAGVFPDQGSNSSLLHWQVDSLPLGSPNRLFQEDVYVWYVWNAQETSLNCSRTGWSAPELLGAMETWFSFPLKKRLPVAGYWSK